MSAVQLLISVFILGVVNNAFAHQLGCQLHETNDLSYDGEITIDYDRTNLAVYTYNKTKYVNFVLLDTVINFNGVFTQNEENVKLSLELPTEVEGAAIIQSVDGTSSLADCSLDLLRLLKYRANVSVEIQEKVTTLAHVCISPKLCSELGKITQDDYIMAKIESHDFAENSVLYKDLSTKYPNIELGKPIDKSQETLQVTLNLLSDFWLASITSLIPNQADGFVKIPDVNESTGTIPLVNKGYFRLKNGSFGNLRNIMRSQDIVINRTGLEFSVEAGVKLPDAKIHFENYALKYGMFDTVGTIDINIDWVSFKIRMKMNYNRSPCNITIDAFQSDIGKISFELSNSNTFEGIINGVLNKLIHSFTKNIIGFLENKIKETVNEQLDRFDCETFRP